MLRGDYGREAAAAVADADLRLLSDLVSKSLVRRSDFGRYELHELLRQYSAEKLAAESPDALATTRERHARHYLGALDERRGALVGKGVVQARDELRRELDNLRVAAEWAVAYWDEDEARGVLAGLNEFFFAHSWFDGAETFERLATVTGELDRASPVALAAVAYRTSLGSALGYDEELDRLALECLPRLREHGMTPGARVVPARPRDQCVLPGRLPGGGGLPRGSRRHGALRRRRAGRGRGALVARLRAAAAGRPRGRDGRRSRHATRKPRSSAIRRCLAYALSKLGILADAEERYADAMRLHMEANELFAGVGDVGGAGYTLSRASLSAYGMEDYEEALRLGRAGYEAFSEVNHRWGMIAALCRIGFAALALGDVDEAQRTFRAALERAHASAAISLELLALSGVGALLRETGEREQAATMLTFALGHEQLPPSYSFAARPALEALEAELPPEQLAAARLAAAAASLDDLVTQALEPVA